LSPKRWLAILAAISIAGCSGAGQSFSSMMPGGGAMTGPGMPGVPSGATIVKVHVPWALPAPASTPSRNGALPPTTFSIVTPTPLPTMAPAGAPPSNASSIQALSFNVSGPTPANATINLSSSSTTCAPSASGTTCQAALGLGPGTYLATVTLYNNANASPLAAVGSAQTVAFTVTNGGSNVVNLAIGATPADIVLVPATAMAAQNAAGGIDLYGAGKHQLAVEMLDANANVIVGGPPMNYNVTSSGGQLAFTVTPPLSSQPNLVTVAYGGPANPAATGSLRITVSQAGPGPNPCIAVGAVCSDSVTADVKQLLAVANSSANTVTLYAGTQNLPVMVLTNSLVNPQGLVFDANGDLFVASEPSSVVEYAPPYTGLPTTIAVGVNHPQALALDARGDLFVANGNGSNTVTEYVAPYTGGPSATISSGVDDPVSLAVDANANLYVANSAANNVTIYAPPYSAAPMTVANGLNGPNSVALDARGNLFVSNLNSTPNSVLEYSPPFSSNSIPSAWITNGISEQGAIAVNPAANLFVPNQGANSVTEYAAPYSGAPTTIKGGQSQPIALAIDATGNLYVANYGNNSVTMYAPPYAGVSWLTFNNGIVNPQALALSPATSLTPIP
jgi:hypothetical protein